MIIRTITKPKKHINFQATGPDETKLQNKHCRVQYDGYEISVSNNIKQMAFSLGKDPKKLKKTRNYIQEIFNDEMDLAGIILAFKINEIRFKKVFLVP